MRALPAMLIALAGCNGIAGIADLRTGDLDGGETPDAASPPDGSPLADAAAADATADTSANADTDSDVGASADAADAEPGPPPCPSPQVGLRIAVLSSASQMFTGVTDGNTINVAVGGVFSSCFAQGTQIELQAVPDQSSATHDWGGTCPPGRRCQFTLNVPTAIDVRLQ